MNWLDATIVIIFLFFIVTAFSAGFIRETVTLASTIAGVVLGGLFYDDIADKILTSIDNETSANAAGFLIIFVGITVAGQLVALLMKPAVTVMQLGLMDQLLGGIFGAVKAAVIIEALLILFVTYPRYDLDETIDESRFGQPMLRASRPMLAVLPEVFDERVDAFDD